LIARKGLSRLGLALWIAWANISLPVPLSPRRRTVTPRRDVDEALLAGDIWRQVFSVCFHGGFLFGRMDTNVLQQALY
jgi:hypothetical protein